MTYDDPNDPNNRHVTLDDRTIYFPQMTVGEFDIKDVPHCLAMICRYNGFTNRFYSVAQHSVMTCELAEAVHGKGSDIARCSLLHDATEAYIGDISRPLKAHLPEYKKIEAHIHNIIVKALSLPTDEAVWREVARFDVMALFVEANNILMRKYAWIKEPDPLWRKSRVATNLILGDEMLPDQAKLLMQRKLEEYGYETGRQRLSHDHRHTNPCL